jgi:hypothetical protein
MYQNLLLHKFYIVILVVIYDDLADDPELRSVKLLNKLFNYRSFGIDKSLSEQEQKISCLVFKLWDQVFRFLEKSQYFYCLEEFVCFAIE